MGMTRKDTLALPFGELLNMIAIEQIKHEGATRKRSQADEEADFMRLLSFK